MGVPLNPADVSLFPGGTSLLSVLFYLCAMGLRFLLVILLCISISSCENANQTGVPYVPVNIQVVVSNPDYIQLQAIGGVLELQGGSKGIIVYHGPDGFRAYDRHCTYQPYEGCRAHVDDTDIQAVDSECCGSKFLLVDGTPIDGPAPFALLQYQTSFDGNMLWITN